MFNCSYNVVATVLILTAFYKVITEIKHVNGFKTLLDPYLDLYKDKFYYWNDYTPYCGSGLESPLITRSALLVELLLQEYCYVYKELYNPLKACISMYWKRLFC